MSQSPIDAGLLDAGLLDAGLLSPVRAGTPAEAAVSDHAWLQAMLDAEAALVRAQARLGTVPPSAAETISQAAQAANFDLRALALAAREAANPVVGLVQALAAVVAERDPAAADYVHRGSTSQDILDTAAMLIAQRCLRVICSDLRRIATALAGLAATHRDTLMIGRTLAMHAVPTTFGLKAAGWRQLVLDAEQRLSRLLDLGLPVSLGGAAGTLAGYLEYARIDRELPISTADSARSGESASARSTGPAESVVSTGLAESVVSTGQAESASSLDGCTGQLPDGYAGQLLDAFVAETGLSRPALPWHSLRTPIADLGAALAFTTGALGKIAVDVQSMTRTEVGEVAEPTVSGRGSSSAMPHKRNPVLSTLIRSAALQVPVLATGLAQCLLSEDERSAGGWHAEWQLLRECLRLAGGAAHTAVELAEGLAVNQQRMLDNVALTDSQVVSERIAAVLTPLLGKAPAKQLLSRAATLASQQGRPLGEVLAELPDLRGHFDDAELAGLCDPAGYLGAAGTLVDAALAD